MREFFSIKVKAINQEIQEFGATVQFFCDEVVPLGPALVREFDSANECSHVWKVFNFRQGLDVYGTQEIQDMAGWRKYINANCKCCPDIRKTCDVFYDGCVVVYNDCELTF